MTSLHHVYVNALLSLHFSLGMICQQHLCLPPLEAEEFQCCYNGHHHGDDECSLDQTTPAHKPGFKAKRACKAAAPAEGIVCVDDMDLVGRLQT